MTPLHEDETKAAQVELFTICGVVSLIIFTIGAIIESYV